ncbi:M23 family metallopeptidase [Spirosoma pollinicola]|uniref:M23ase beta-sheet core domain-containing protein n=1 Tax=Spirosoma pollinicola TaxID=2057025 RepID=A0A2K8Z9E5_9BACT|nr:M23 family metallopeptidase [Spirosoma pollinicola]AUD06449.1 hypothetical protein CWM47_34180 [Spirosoma pollinicola]RZM28971.1 MAG: M23 family metallopeptidase [Pedobacter sp.]
MKNIFRFIISIALTGAFHSAAGQVMFSRPVRQSIQLGDSDSLMTGRATKPTQSDKASFVVTFMGQSIYPVTEKAAMPPVTAPSHFKAVNIKSLSQSDSLVVLLLEDSLSKIRTQLRNFTTPKSLSPDNLLRTIPSILPIRIRSWSDYRVSSGFGLRYHPVRGTVHNHAGIDLPQAKYSPVYATADGIVDRVVWQPDGMGLAIYIKHASGYLTGYGHLEDHSVLVGESITRGQVIGHIGETGMTTGPHLHYSVLWGNEPVDPTEYCFLLMKRLQAATLTTTPLTQQRKYVGKVRLASTGFKPKNAPRSLIKAEFIEPLKPVTMPRSSSLMALGLGKRILTVGR